MMVDKEIWVKLKDSLLILMSIKMKNNPRIILKKNYY